MALLENLQRPTPYRILVENPMENTTIFYQIWGANHVSRGGGLSPPCPRLATWLGCGVSDLVKTNLESLGIGKYFIYAFIHI